MAGKHKAPDRRRLYSEAIRLAIMLLVLAVVLLGGAVVASNLLEGGDTTTVTTAPQAITTTSVLPETISTQATTTSTTTTEPSTTTTTMPTTTSTLPPVRQPAEVTVLVLNSTGAVGMAGRLTARIDDLGYQTLEADNFSPRLDISRIWFAPGFDREAAALVDLVPDAIVEARPEDGDGSDITIVLGASFDE